MRQFNLKQEWLIPYDYNEDPSPGRTIYPEPMRMAEPGWRQQNFRPSEEVMRREDVAGDEMLAAAREWLAHVEAGRIK